MEALSINHALVTLNQRTEVAKSRVHHHAKSVQSNIELRVDNTKFRSIELDSVVIESRASRRLLYDDVANFVERDKFNQVLGLSIHV